MSYLPCMNPSCKSFGSPHPNCRCWGQKEVFFAEGGDVKGSFCSENRSHDPGCGYHSDLPLDNPEECAAYAIAHKGCAGFMGKKIFDGIGKEYLSHVKSGRKKVADEVNSLFGEGGGSETIPDNGIREKIKKFVDDGGIMGQMRDAPVQEFAEGGGVKDILPAHNVVNSAIRGRVAQYLHSLAPQKNSPRLAFDSHINNPEAERKYNRAIDIAHSPLSVLAHVRKGTVLPEHVQHMMAMYPELKTQLDKHITNRIVAAQIDEKKPTYHSRQGMSLFMGASLSSELTPSNIQAAQNTFQAKKAMQEQQSAPKPGKAKNGTAPLSKADDDVWTKDQAAEKRLIAER